MEVLVLLSSMLLHQIQTGLLLEIRIVQCISLLLRLPRKCQINLIQSVRLARWVKALDSEPSEALLLSALVSFFCGSDRLELSCKGSVNIFTAGRSLALTTQKDYLAINHVYLASLVLSILM